MKILLTVLALAVIDPLVEARADDLSEMFSESSLNAVAAAIVAEQEPPLPPPFQQSSRPYWTTYAWLTAATIYDVESTFYLLGRCDECREANPVSRPFIERGRAATYAYSLAVNAAVMYIARRMQSRGDEWWRLAPVALTAVHGAAGTWNVYQATSPPD